MHRLPYTLYVLQFDCTLEDLTDLEIFIDNYYHHLHSTMDNTDALKPDSKRRKRDSATDTDDLHTTEVEVSVLASINKKLDILVTSHEELKDMRESLEFAHNQIGTLQQSNQELQTSITTLTQQMQKVSAENKQMKETILDIQTRSMRDNLIFSGIPEISPDNPELQIQNFMHSQLKLPADVVQNITFHRVHRLGKQQQDKTRPIIAKFEHYQQKELIKSKGKLLKDTHFGMNDQYPREINERRKVLYPILKENRRNNIRAVLAVDKLYINGQLFRSHEKTPWLF